MFSRLKQRFNDMRTLSTLCRMAESHANADGQKEPGAEHFILAALELPDGSARRAFARIQADPDRFRDAIAQQYRDALRSVGIESTGAESAGGQAAPLVANQGPYRAKASARTLMQGMAEQRKSDRSAALLGAHVIAAALLSEHGVSARALKAMHVNAAELAAAARAEIEATLD